MKIKIIFFSLILLLLFFISVSAHVALDYPRGGETFAPGEYVVIKWVNLIDHGAADWDLYFSEDGGNTWEELAVQLPKSQLQYQWTTPQIQTHQARIKIVQDNVTGYDYQDSSGDFTISSSTNIRNQDVKIEKLRLFPAYPNPFNGSTVISFSIPERSLVRLEIFNIAGEKVVTLKNTGYMPGNHRVSWRAEDLPSGIYFFKMTAGDKAKIQRLILMK